MDIDDILKDLTTSVNQNENNCDVVYYHEGIKVGRINATVYPSGMNGLPQPAIMINSMDVDDLLKHLGVADDETVMNLRTDAANRLSLLF